MERRLRDEGRNRCQDTTKGRSSSQAGASHGVCLLPPGLLLKRILLKASMAVGLTHLSCICSGGWTLGWAKGHSCTSSQKATGSGVGWTGGLLLARGRPGLHLIPWPRQPAKQVRTPALQVRKHKDPRRSHLSHPKKQQRARSRTPPTLQALLAREPGVQKRRSKNSSRKLHRHSIANECKHEWQQSLWDSFPFDVQNKRPFCLCMCRLLNCVICILTPCEAALRLDAISCPCRVLYQEQRKRPVLGIVKWNGGSHECCSFCTSNQRLFINCWTEQNQSIVITRWQQIITTTKTTITETNKAEEPIDKKQREEKNRPKTRISSRCRQCCCSSSPSASKQSYG